MIRQPELPGEADPPGQLHAIGVNERMTLPGAVGAQPATSTPVSYRPRVSQARGSASARRWSRAVDTTVCFLPPDSAMVKSRGRVPVFCRVSVRVRTWSVLATSSTVLGFTSARALVRAKSAVTVWSSATVTGFCAEA